MSKFQINLPFFIPFSPKDGTLGGAGPPDAKSGERNLLQAGEQITEYCRSSAHCYLTGTADARVDPARPPQFAEAGVYWRARAETLYRSLAISTSIMS